HVALFLHFTSYVYVSRFTIQLFNDLRFGSPLPLPLRFTFHAPVSSPYALINKPQPFHFRRIEQVAAVEHDGMAHALAGALQLELLELLPFGGNHQRVTILRDLV